MKRFPLCVFSSLICTSSFALTVPVALTDKANTPIGTIEITETPKGVQLMPDLKNLPSGPHGFHLHQNPSCVDQGMAAGGHYDPNKTGKHLGPEGKGHLGDLPVLEVAADGTAKAPLLVPRLKLKDFVGHSLMIHAGGDNYSDSPEKLGGGGARIACGIIKK